MPAGVRDVEVGSRSGNPHPGVRVGDAVSAPGIDEVEAERPAGLVEVELVGVLVVRDVEIRTPVAVHVEELGAEAVVVRLRIDSHLRAHLLEVAVALVQEELVVDALEVRRKAAHRAVDRVCEIRVAGDEQVGTAVAVHVGDRRA